MNEKCREENKVTDTLINVIENLRVLENICGRLKTKLNGNALCESECEAIEKRYEDRGILALSEEISKRSNDLGLLFDKEISKI